MIRKYFLANILCQLLAAQLLLACLGADLQSDQLQLVPISVGGSPNRQKKENLSLRDVDYAIRNRDYPEAAVLLSRLRQDELLQDDYQKYLKAIAEGLGDLFLETLEREGILEALPAYYSLQSLGVAGNYILEGEFADQLFELYVKKKYLGAALHLAQTSIAGNVELSAAVKNKLREFVEGQYQDNISSAGGLDFWRQRIEGTVTVIVEMGTDRIPYTPFYLPVKEIGSGFFVDNQGSIVTNHHVIASQTDGKRGKGHIYVKLAGKDELVPAKLLGWDPNRDLALLQISRKTPYLLQMNSTFNQIRFGTKSQNTNPALFVGNELFAIGAPGGLESTLTSGRVSARGRNILPLTEVLQIDVPANPGNSGGPLLNEQGLVEGVVFAKNNAGYEGIAFAIPSDTLASVLPRLYRQGKVPNSWLGILVDEYNNSADYLEIRYIFPNSPAADSALQPGQRIVSSLQHSYNQIKALQSQIANQPAASIAKLLVRDPQTDRQQEVLLQLDLRPDKPMYHNLGQDSTTALFYALFGAKLTPSLRRRNEFEILATVPYSQVSQLNLDQGDTIQLLDWRIDTGKNIIIARISYRYADSLEQTSMQSVLIQQLDLPNIL